MAAPSYAGHSGAGNALGYDDFPVGEGPGKIASGPAVAAAKTKADQADAKADVADGKADAAQATADVAAVKATDTGNAIKSTIWQITVGAFSAYAANQRNALVTCKTPNLNGGSNIISSRLRVQLWNDVDMSIPSTSTQASILGGGSGSVVSGNNTADMVISTDGTAGTFSLNLTRVGVGPDPYVSVIAVVPAKANNGCAFTQYANGPVVMA